ncbi:riboflavin kinase [Absiella sp. AM54-8XD]|uniref:riboflavin kinase n=1 Tax=Absiella sp. AM54-8XD TaxID=2292279 RepID=UPI001F28BFAC|nr:riboflavin kinase [Absiella sp. AM54-8XD]
MGRTVGFPTANLLMDDHYITPKQGVYVGEVLCKGIWYPAIMNVGHNPSFNYQKDTSMEAHLLDFQDDIYGEAVVFRFLSFLREECRFPGKDAFMEQLKKDEQTARTYFQKRKEGSACV